MIKKMIKTLPVLAAILTISISSVSIASPVTLVEYRGHWASRAITHLYTLGIIKDWPGGKLHTDEAATRAEFITLINRIFNFTDKSAEAFNDVRLDAWYAPEAAKARAAGYIQGDSSGNFRPNDPISRQEAAVVLARVFQLKAQDPKSADKFSDARAIATWSKDAVSAMIEKGYISGRGGNYFAPGDYITCAETIQLIDNIVDELANVADTYVGDIKGNLIVNTGNVVLKDIIVQGNLYLTPGIGSGTVKLENVTVRGKTFINGGGEAGISINNSALQGMTTVNSKDGMTKVILKGNSNVPNVELLSGVQLQEGFLKGIGVEHIFISKAVQGHSAKLDGDFETIIVEAEDGKVEILDGKISNITIAESASKVNVKVSKGAIGEVSIKSADTALDLIGGTVSKVTVVKDTLNTKIYAGDQVLVKNIVADAGVKVTGAGMIETVAINANGVSMDYKPTNVTISPDVVASIGGSQAGSVTPSSGRPTAVYGGSGTSTSSGSGGGSSGVDSGQQMPAISSFVKEAGLVPGRATVIVGLDTSTPEAYRVFVGSVELTYFSSNQKFGSVDVPEDTATRGNVRVERK